MKTLLFTLLVLVGGSCYGQDYFESPIERSFHMSLQRYGIISVKQLLTESDISRIVDEVIRRLDERRELDSISAIDNLWRDKQPEPLSFYFPDSPLEMVIDTVRTCSFQPLIKNCLICVKIDTLYRLTPEQIERLK